MFPVRERGKGKKDKKRCRSFAALLVLTVTLFSAAFLIPQCYAADDETDRAPYVVDWGLFDEGTGNETSLMKSGVIEGDTSGMVFYIRFDHNVAQMDGTINIGEANCSLVSVVSNGGKAVASTAWVKDTQLEFQYRQYIFITVTGTVDPSKYYHIKVAPGITAKNGFTNNGSANLYFSFPTSGAGDEPVPLEEETENNTESIIDNTTQNEKNPAKAPKKSSTSDLAKSGSSSGSQSHSGGIQTANRETVGNSAQMPLQQKTNTVLEVYQLDAALFDNTAETVEEQKKDDFTDTMGRDTRSMVALSVMVALCLLMIAMGAVYEALSFRYRLRHR